jgi:GNAT superfamily N-acetyltransferase
MILPRTIGVDGPLVLVRAGATQRRLLAEMYGSFEPKTAALGLPPRMPADIERWLASLDRYPAFVIYDGDRIAGHAVLCPEGDSGEVAVFVHQDYRGWGLGRRLLEALIVEAAALGLRRIWGIAEPDNLPMLRLARKCGFVSGRDPGEFYLKLSTEPVEEQPRLTAAA